MDSDTSRVRLTYVANYHDNRIGNLIAPELAPLDFVEGTTFDLATDDYVGPAPGGEDLEIGFSPDALASVSYPFEADDVPDQADLEDLLFAARSRLWKQQESFQTFPGVRVYIDLPDSRCFTFDLASEGAEIVPARAPLAEPYLRCSVDPRLLGRLLCRDVHWNNAEIGCHIDFDRRPDVFLPDVHTLMSFFHIPSGYRQLPGRLPVGAASA